MSCCNISPDRNPIEIEGLPHYLPIQFKPYLDSDPNSIIKYKSMSTYLSNMHTTINPKNIPLFQKVNRDILKMYISPDESILTQKITTIENYNGDHVSGHYLNIISWIVIIIFILYLM